VLPDSHVRLTLPADASFLTVCRAALSGILADAGDDEVEESKLVLSEVCAAAVAHGDGGHLDVEFRPKPGAIEIVVSAPGAETILADPVAREVLDRLTSRWSVDRDSGGKGSVTFARRLRRPPAAAS
jgi:anti-sigma regulatory factor (Ser/Thr protein kinase)